MRRQRAHTPPARRRRVGHHRRARDGDARQRHVREEVAATNRAAAHARAVVLFDGVCNLCNGAVRFIAANDPAGRFAFASLQSARARELLGERAGDPREPDSVVLVQDGVRYERSDAALYIALGLRAPWPLLFAAILIPRAARDALYRWIARNRYRWFGRTEACALPAPELRDRFLSGGIDAAAEPRG